MIRLSILSALSDRLFSVSRVLEDSEDVEESSTILESLVESSSLSSVPTDPELDSDSDSLVVPTSMNTDDEPSSLSSRVEVLGSLLDRLEWVVVVLDDWDTKRNSARYLESVTGLLNRINLDVLCRI